MSRKIQRSMWRCGQRRRSPRISALDAWKPHQPTTPFSSRMEGHQHSGTSTSGIKRKRQLGTESPKQEEHSTNSDQQFVIQAKGSAKLGDHATFTSQSSVVSPVPFMPEKHILELVLDTLQRRDTFEIFAEPVDPKEVEDYYKIIKEPMDFGTMRAKLHEGMYKNLEQFEHDVFLIPRNAMHFNSTATIYFRQARAIYELAKKVFHILKSDPEKFELEFSGTRRRSSRRPLGEGKVVNFNSSTRLASNEKSSHMTTNVTPKGRQCSSHGPSNLRSIRGNPVFSCTATHVDTRNYVFSPGFRDGQRLKLAEADQCCTYRPWMSFHNESDSIISTIYGDPKPLICVNQRDISYRESLMLFAKDLGPTAQMVANWKLQGWQKDTPHFQFPASNCMGKLATSQVPDEFPPAQKAPPSTQDTLKTSTDIIDLTDADDGEKVYSSDWMHNHSALGVRIATKNGGLSSHECDEMKAFSSICDRNKVIEKQVYSLQQGFHSSTSGAQDLNSSFTNSNDTSKKSVEAMVLDSGKMDNQVQQLALDSEHSHSNGFERKLRNNNSSAAASSSWHDNNSSAAASSSWHWHARGVSGLSRVGGSTNGMISSCIAAAVPKGGMDLMSSSSSQADHSVKSNRVVPVVTSPSPFAFDLPFLKSRLDQMNHLGRASSHNTD